MTEVKPTWPERGISRWCKKCDEVVVPKIPGYCDACFCSFETNGHQKDTPRERTARQSVLCECGGTKAKGKKKCSGCYKIHPTVDGHRTATSKVDNPHRVCRLCAKPIRKGQSYLVYQDVHIDCYNKAPFPKNPRQVRHGFMGAAIANQLREIASDMCPVGEIIPQDIAEDVWGLINCIRAKNAEKRGEEVEFCL